MNYDSTESNLRLIYSLSSVDELYRTIQLEKGDFKIDVSFSSSIDSFTRQFLEQISSKWPPGWSSLADQLHGFVEDNSYENIHIVTEVLTDANARDLVLFISLLNDVASCFPTKHFVAIFYFILSE
jgi:hypothetical protein